MTHRVVKESFVEITDDKTPELYEVENTLIKYYWEGSSITYHVMDDGDRQSFVCYCYGIKFKELPAFLNEGVIKFTLIHDKDEFNIGEMKGYHWYIAFKNTYIGGDNPKVCITAMLNYYINIFEEQIKHLKGIKEK